MSGSNREVRGVIPAIDSTKVIEVNPNGTSQECSSCGHKVKKTLSQRIHNCPVCQTSICRDLNASLNIKARGTHALKAQKMSSMKSL
jgi:putative transposase